MNVTLNDLSPESIAKFWYPDGEGTAYIELNDGRTLNFDKFSRKAEDQAFQAWMDENFDKLNPNAEITDERDTPWGSHVEDFQG